MVQWIRLRTPNAGGSGSIASRGTRLCMHAATKSLHATTKKPACRNYEARVPQLRSLHASTKKDPTCRN